MYHSTLLQDVYAWLVIIEIQYRIITVLIAIISLQSQSLLFLTLHHGNYSPKQEHLVDTIEVVC